MDEWVLAGLVLGGLAAVVLAVFAYRRRGRLDVADEPDPLFILGISLAGTGAALTAAIGPAMLGMSAVGVALIVIGIRRTQARR